jgi:hypothetical protein
VTNLVAFSSIAILFFELAVSEVSCNRITTIMVVLWLFLKIKIKNNPLVYLNSHPKEIIA